MTHEGALKWAAALAEMGDGFGGCWPRLKSAVRRGKILDLGLGI